MIQKRKKGKRQRERERVSASASARKRTKPRGQKTKKPHSYRSHRSPKLLLVQNNTRSTKKIPSICINPPFPYRSYRIPLGACSIKQVTAAEYKANSSKAVPCKKSSFLPDSSAAASAATAPINIFRGNKNAIPASSPSLFLFPQTPEGVSTRFEILLKVTRPADK